MRILVLALGAALGLWLAAFAPVRAFEIEDERQFGPRGVTPLEVLSTTDISILQPVITAWLEANPGMGLHYVMASSQEVYRAIAEEDRQFDVVISSAMDLQMKLANDGKAQALPEDAMARQPGWARWRDVLVAVAQEPVVLVLSDGALPKGQERPSTRRQLNAMLRDNPECADSEHDAFGADTPGLVVAPTFDPTDDVAAPYIATGVRPKVVILREQGVNSHVETAHAFDRAGFDAYDVHMTDLQSGRFDLGDAVGLVACGGFSYGDTLGAGEGWARSVLFNPRLTEMFTDFFARTDSFGLGICNGWQMFGALADIIPGAEAWPRFTRNRSEQFEARLSLVEVLDSPSIFFTGMAGSRVPIAVAHGEGLADFSMQGDPATVVRSARFTLADGTPATSYPANPNGSAQGLTAVTTADGRFTAMMPHPERVARNAQLSWTPAPLAEESPWLRMFRNARVWVG